MSGRYPLLSGVMLLLIPLSCLVTYLTIGDSNYAWVNAIGLLLTPFAIFCWIFTTIRAIHVIEVRFWLIPSTYVTLFAGVIALVICLIMVWYSGMAEGNGQRMQDFTLYVAAGILYAGCVAWSYLYNWRRTKSAILAFSLTFLQTISAAFAIGLLALLLDGRNTKRYERDHGISKLTGLACPCSPTISKILPPARMTTWK